MEVEAANDALMGERDVRLERRPRHHAVAPDLTEPAPLVSEAPERNELHVSQQPGRIGHGLLTPFLRTKSLTA